MRRFSKSSEIRFLMASFSKMSLYLTLLDARRVEKSEAILALLDGFEELHLDW